MSVPETSVGKRRALVFLPEKVLSPETLDKIRTRGFRARFQSLQRLGKPLRTLLFVALLTSLSYLAIVQLRHLFFGTSYFEIKQIEVSGLETLPREDVLKLAGVAPGLNILSLDKDAIRKRLLSHPLVSDVSVKLDGLYTLRIAVQQRTPLLYVKTESQFLEVSEDGMVLAAGDFERLDLPVITGLNLEKAQPGDRIADDDGFLEARTWVKTLGAQILEEVSELDFSSVQNPHLFLATGQKVFPKSLEDFRERYTFLCALLDNLRKNNVEPDYLDMRAPNEIVIKPRKAKN